MSGPEHQRVISCLHKTYNYWSLQISVSGKTGNNIQSYKKSEHKERPLELREKWTVHQIWLIQNKYRRKKRWDWTDLKGKKLLKAYTWVINSTLFFASYHYPYHRQDDKKALSPNPFGIKSGNICIGKPLNNPRFLVGRGNWQLEKIKICDNLFRMMPA